MSELHYPDPHNRAFGVEIECGITTRMDDEDDRGGCAIVADLFRLDWDDYDEYGEYDGWSVCADGTEVELRTPPLEGERGFSILRQTMETLKNAGAYVTTMDGLHVHHDAPEFEGNPELMLRAVVSWMNNLGAIHDMVAPRRRTSVACPTWPSERIEMLAEWVANPEVPLRLSRYDLNIEALRTHGTIEFRLHEGTLDADVAIAWIKFGQRFLHEIVSNADPVESHVRDTDFLSRIHLDDEAIAILEAKKHRNYRTAGQRFLSRY